MTRARLRWPHLALLPVALVLCADLDDDWGHGGGGDHSDDDERGGCCHKPSAPPPGPPAPRVTRSACTVTVEGLDPHDLTCTWTYETSPQSGTAHYRLAAADRWAVEGGEVDFDAAAQPPTLTIGEPLQVNHEYSWNRTPNELHGAVTFYPPHPAAAAHPPAIAHGWTGYDWPVTAHWATLVLTDAAAPHGRLRGAMELLGADGSVVPDRAIGFQVDF